MTAEQTRKGIIEAVIGLTCPTTLGVLLEFAQAAHVLDLTDRRVATILSYRLGELQSTQGVNDAELIPITLLGVLIKRGDERSADSREALRNAAFIDFDQFDRVVD